MELAAARTRYGLLLLLLISATFAGNNALIAQTGSFDYYYRVYFTDKGDYSEGDFPPHSLFSDRAVARREKYGIETPGYTDLPVYKPYLEQVKSLGFTLHSTSKWMNTGLFMANGNADTSIISALPFVSRVMIVKRPGSKGSYNSKLDIREQSEELPPFDRPITMINGYSLHNSGYDGTGIQIAVLDGGFYKVNTIESLQPLRSRGGIKGTLDVIKKSGYVYDYHNHGTAVLSVLAGKIPFTIAGTAPGADYWLIRTEDVNSEYPVEEDFWVAGAEFADSVGVDIITSSLGYYNFDDPSMDYKFADMDGNTTFVTRGADIAASKGILVVASAGNERNKEWVRIIAPSDGDDVLAAGAVDGYNYISSFSSAGPSADGRVKPDVAAQGVSVPVQVNEYSVSRANGTSFSCPVISGISACVMQALPEADHRMIIGAFHLSSSRAASPDSLYGYGIPDMSEMFDLLQEQLITYPENDIIIGPNPFIQYIEIIFREPPEKLLLQVYDLSGKLVFYRDYQEYISRRVTLNDLFLPNQGMYIIRLVTAKGTYSRKVIKIKE